jgi:peptide/nickel transport system substrate-binding protein
LEYAPAWEYFADGPTGPVFGRQFDLAVFAWYNDVEPPCNLFVSGQIPDQDNWGLPNATGFSNEEYDAACEAALAALPGTYEYENHHIDAQTTFSQQIPALPLFWRTRVAVARAGVSNFFLDPSEDSELSRIEEIVFEP